MQQAGEHSLEVTTDESGRFIFTTCPGEYKLLAWDTTQQQVGDVNLKALR